MAKKHSTKDYFGLPKWASILLAIFPVTNWVMGAATRFKRGHWVAGLLCILCGGFMILHIIDLIQICLKQRLTCFA